MRTPIRNPKLRELLNASREIGSARIETECHVEELMYHQLGGLYPREVSTLTIDTSAEKTSERLLRSLLQLEQLRASPARNNTISALECAKAEYERDVDEPDAQIVADLTLLIELLGGGGRE